MVLGILADRFLADQSFLQTQNNYNVRKLTVNSVLTIRDRLICCASIGTSVIVRVYLCFAANLDCCNFEVLLKNREIVLLTNRETIVLIGKTWSQTQRFFESVNQSSITSLRWSAKSSTFQFYAERWVC